MYFFILSPFRLYRRCRVSGTVYILSQSVASRKKKIARNSSKKFFSQLIFIDKNTE